MCRACPVLLQPSQLHYKISQEDHSKYRLSALHTTQWLSMTSLALHMGSSTQLKPFFDLLLRLPVDCFIPTAVDPSASSAPSLIYLALPTLFDLVLLASPIHFDPALLLLLAPPAFFDLALLTFLDLLFLLARPDFFVLALPNFVDLALISLFAFSYPSLFDRALLTFFDLLSLLSPPAFFDLALLSLLAPSSPSPFDLALPTFFDLAQLSLLAPSPFYLVLPFFDLAPLSLLVPSPFDIARSTLFVLHHN